MGGPGRRQDNLLLDGEERRRSGWMELEEVQREYLWTDEEEETEEKIKSLRRLVRLIMSQLRMDREMKWWKRGGEKCHKTSSPAY